MLIRWRGGMRLLHDDFLAQIETMILPDDIKQYIYAQTQPARIKQLLEEQNRYLNTLENLITIQNTAASNEIKVYCEQQVSLLGKELKKEENKNPEPAINNNEQVFVEQFPGYFKTLQHLAQTLQDAPAAICSQLPSMSMSILETTQGTSLTTELKKLTLEQIENFITASAKKYETEPSKSMQLIKDAMQAYLETQYEQVKALDKHDGYQQIITRTTQLVIQITSKNSLSNLSKVIDSTLSQKFKFDPKEPAWPRSMLLTRELYNVLESGQEARAAYLQRCKKNLKDSLFWGRDIYEMKLFPDADKQYNAMREKKLINDYINGRVTAPEKSCTTLAEKKLWIGLAKYINYRKEYHKHIEELQKRKELIQNQIELNETSQKNKKNQPK